MNDVLFRSAEKGPAFGRRKLLAGMVAHEFAEIDGRPVMLEFKPRIEYREEWEPMPWCIVADQGRVLAAGEVDG